VTARASWHSWAASSFGPSLFGDALPPFLPPPPPSSAFVDRDDPSTAATPAAAASAAPALPPPPPSSAFDNRDDPSTAATPAAAAAAASAAPALPPALLGLGPRMSATGFFDPRGVGIPAEIGRQGGREGGREGGRVQYLAKKGCLSFLFNYRVIRLFILPSLPPSPPPSHQPWSSSPTSSLPALPPLPPPHLPLPRPLSYSVTPAGSCSLPLVLLWLAMAI